jgi:multidrug resistance efflux pump
MQHMSMPFVRSMRSLETDHFRRAIVMLLIAAALLIAWAGWMVLAQVPLYAATQTAHLMVNHEDVARFNIVASFEPAVALGRIYPGQTAVMRLDGFPWSQYGTIPATVQRVATEVIDGSVQVELSIIPNARSTVPLQQGLPGAVEIELERISPALLLLRAAGTLIRD